MFDWTSGQNTHEAGGKDLAGFLEAYRRFYLPCPASCSSNDSLPEVENSETFWNAVGSKAARSCERKNCANDAADMRIKATQQQQGGEQIAVYWLPGHHQGER